MASYEKFLSLLKDEVELSRREAVAYRIGVNVQSLMNYIRRKSVPSATIVFNALRAYPALLASVLPDDTTVADMTSPSSDMAVR